MQRNIKEIVREIVEKRNKQLIKVYLSGEALKIMEGMFGLSKTRIYAILCENNIMKERKSKLHLTRKTKHAKIGR